MDCTQADVRQHLARFQSLYTKVRFITTSPLSFIGKNFYCSDLEQFESLTAIQEGDLMALWEVNIILRR